MIKNKSNPFTFLLLFLFFSIFYNSCREDKKEIETGDNKAKIETDSIVSKALLNANNEGTSDSIQEKDLKSKTEINNKNSDKKENIKIIAYYFHPTARCKECINIENFTKELIDTKYSKEQKNGLIEYKVINIDDSVNEHFREDYDLKFSTVILAKFVDGKQTKWTNLEHVWKFANDKDKFFIYAKIEIKKFLKDGEM